MCEAGLFHPYPEYSRVDSYPWSFPTPEAGPSRTRFSHSAPPLCQPPATPALVLLALVLPALVPPAHCSKLAACGPEPTSALYQPVRHFTNLVVHCSCLLSSLLITVFAAARGGVSVSSYRLCEPSPHQYFPVLLVLLKACIVRSCTNPVNHPPPPLLSSLLLTAQNLQLYLAQCIDSMVFESQHPQKIINLLFAITIKAIS